MNLPLEQDNSKKDVPFNIPIGANKSNLAIQVQAHPINSFTNLRDAIYIKTDEDKYLEEKEFKIRQEFNDFIYEYYGKRGHKLDQYTKNKLWTSFKFDKKRQENGLITYLVNWMEKIEDEYF